MLGGEGAGLGLGLGLGLGDLINSIPLCREDLAGILFDPPKKMQGGDAHSIRTEAQLSDQDKENPLRRWFLNEDDISKEEQVATIAVVHEHTYLVEALERERQRLEQNGVFIPVLKVAFDILPEGSSPLSSSEAEKLATAPRTPKSYVHHRVVHHDDTKEGPDLLGMTRWMCITA